MWQLYNTIKLGLPEKDHEFLIDEVISILKNIEPPEFKDALSLMWGNKLTKVKNSTELPVIFLKGLKQNGFFEFVSFIKEFIK